MPVAGAGGFLSGLLFPGLDDRLAQHITPNPNPLAQQGQPAKPGQVDQLGNPVPSGPPPGSNLAPAAVTQPDPANAANVAALTQPSNAYARDALAATRRDAMGAGLNQGFGEIAAGFGTAQQQQSKQAALARGGGVGDSLGDLAKIQGMQDTTIADNEHARFMANAHIFAQTLSQSLGRPVSDQEATEIMNSPDLMKAFGGAAGANATTTGTQKDAEAATRAYAAAHPEASPKDIADYKANLIAGGMGGSDLEQRQYLAERSAALAAGQKDFPDFLTWKNQHATAAKEQDAAATFKLQGKEDFSGVDTTLTRNEKTVDSLLSDIDATKKALSDPEFMTTGKFAANAPSWLTADPKVKAAAAAINTLRSELSSEGLRNVKNVRNVREFNALAGALTSALDPNNPNLEEALKDIKHKFEVAHAQAYATAGKQIPYVYHGLADPTYLDKSDPLYTGATEEAPPKDAPKTESGNGPKIKNYNPKTGEFE